MATTNPPELAADTEPPGADALTHLLFSCYWLCDNPQQSPAYIRYRPCRMITSRLCLILFSALFIGMQAYALWINSRYKWDFIFVMLLWVGLYLVRDRIRLHPLHYLLFGVFLFLHFAGMFGWYQTYPLGLEYDHWVHGFFGFVSSLMVLRTYHHYGVYSPPMIAVAAVAVILGFSAFHEIFEYLGALAVGEGEGVLFIGAGDLDEWDTQKDMLNNLIGALIGLVVFHLTRYWPGSEQAGSKNGPR